MIEQFENLTDAETSLLLSAPALVSVMAMSNDEEMGDKEKADAFKLAHLKTFTAGPRLVPYYQEVEIRFEANFLDAVSKYMPFDDGRRKALTEKVDTVNVTIGKLEGGFSDLLRASLKQYAEHVKKAKRSVVEDFIFPFPLAGITD